MAEFRTFPEDEEMDAGYADLQFAQWTADDIMMSGMNDRIMNDEPISGELMLLAAKKPAEWLDVWTSILGDAELQTYIATHNLNMPTVMRCSAYGSTADAATLMRDSITNIVLDLDEKRHYTASFSLEEQPYVLLMVSAGIEERQINEWASTDFPDIIRLHSSGVEPRFISTMLRADIDASLAASLLNKEA